MTGRMAGRATFVAAGVAMALLLAGCSSSTEPSGSEPIRASAPRQIAIVGDPVIERTESSNLSIVYLSVTAPDSTLHVRWWPTRLLVETDRGYRQDVLLIPDSCLEPQEIGLRFPFTFEWFQCDGIGLVNKTVLTVETIDQIEQLVSGRLSDQQIFYARPGAVYYFRVPLGREAVAEAMRRLDGLADTEDVFHGTAAPLCVLTGDRACPPWSLSKRLNYSFGAASRGTLPVSRGGWIRATYTEASGARKVTQLDF